MKPAVQGGAGTGFGEVAVVERELGQPGLAVTEPDDDFRDQQPGLMGGGLGEGEGAEGDRAGAGAAHTVLDVCLQDLVAPPDVRFQEPLGSGGSETGYLAEAHETGLAAGPAEDIVPDQKRRQAPGESFGIEGDCQGAERARHDGITLARDRPLGGYTRAGRACAGPPRPLPQVKAASIGGPFVGAPII
ncbi:hypothetical protein SRABI128_05840 [Microbacterium sp. Bi128]|nr:hypothetical protein SRABI128_05840 [Microbacterium sp. Bi128]